MPDTQYTRRGSLAESGIVGTPANAGGLLQGSITLSPVAIVKAWPQTVGTDALVPLFAFTSAEPQRRFITIIRAEDKGWLIRLNEQWSIRWLQVTDPLRAAQSRWQRQHAQSHPAIINPIPARRKRRGMLNAVATSGRRRCVKPAVVYQLRKPALDIEWQFMLLRCGAEPAHHELSGRSTSARVSRTQQNKLT